MRRIPIQPRDHWQTIVESQGLSYHSIDGRPYWDESAYYAFTARQIDEIEHATYALNDMCLAAVQHVIDEDRFDEFEIPDSHRQYVRESWERDDLTLYARFDLAYDGTTPPKMLEYNADTPTSLIEASVAQWFWLKDRFPARDQFNAIHERLIEAWRSIAQATAGTMHFASVGHSHEDFMTVTYLRETAEAAGLRSRYIDVADIGWDTMHGEFVGLEGNVIETCFKLYPWEWMTAEPFGTHLLLGRTKWFEPAWKMLLSNKAILVVLWELFPRSPYLLEASFARIAGDHVRKPLLSREGANVQLVGAGGAVEWATDGPYDGKTVYQRRARLPKTAGGFPIIGSWMINGWAAGIGIREDESPITGNTSRFVPHVIAG